MDVDPSAWTLFIDGSSTSNVSGVSIVFRTPEGAVIEQAIRIAFKASNNEVEY